MEHATESALMAMRTVMQVAATLSLLLGISPMIRGQVRVKWVVTALASCVMFGVMSLMISVLVGIDTDGAETSDATGARTPPPDIDWGLTGLLLLGILVAGAAGYAGLRLAARISRRRAEAAQRRRERLEAADPLRVARDKAPDLTADVETAMHRIGLLRMMEGRISDQQDADALAIVNGRLPELMERYRQAAEISTPEETAELARTALGSVVEIGRIAEEARRRMASALGDQVRTDSRYIGMRSGAAAGEFRIDN